MERFGAAVVSRGWRRVKQYWSAAGLAVIVPFTPLRVAVVHGQSMEPTLQPGQLVLCDRLYYRTHPITPGDVVLLRMGGETWVKRVYARGGDTFWVWSEEEDASVRWDPIRVAARAEFAHMAEQFRQAGICNARVTKVRLPEGKLFVMGDGLTSFDSRECGPVDADQVLGRVIPLPGQHLEALPAAQELPSPRRAREMALGQAGVAPRGDDLTWTDGGRK